MIKVFLVRHGRTIWNKEQIFRGTKDVPLDEVGKEEALLVGERLKEEELSAVYSSPLSRAKETAEVIARFHKMEVQCLAGLNDLHFGEWEGIHHKEVKERYPDLYQKWQQEPHRVIFPRGEGLDEVRSRAMEAIEDIITRHPQGVVALVSHRVVLKVVICALLGLDNSRFWHIGQDTAAINCFHYRDGKWIVSLLNDVCHLKGLGEEKGKVDF
ncbi:MAG: histidine phosphatase family protein [Deltaproteobacteria bacterium]|nr:histidine phosphatase family protein [Deltaproteobacteria bacterium]